MPFDPLPRSAGEGEGGGVFVLHFETIPDALTLTLSLRQGEGIQKHRASQLSPDSIGGQLRVTNTFCVLFPIPRTAVGLPLA
jgi:hypothetical protein